VIALIKRATEERSVEANVNLAYRYERGEGVVRDRAQVNSWFEPAASQGEVTTQYDLAVYYANGFSGRT
jgi:TPR repeat protein